MVGFGWVVEEVVLLAGWDRGIGGEAVAPLGEFVGVRIHNWFTLSRVSSVIREPRDFNSW